ncbi:ArnT family glycosyltransferase [Acetobacter orientalis]|uniref:ArnT family glycosyltransferase n=1 Tax=Acetobacter orientalis TaxID=146474 RepID=UPI0039EAFD2F
MMRSKAVSFLKGRLLAPLLLLLCAIILRGITFGNPMLEPDEQFYLFAGGRLLQGDLPYVDVWDRKPLGIFLIYSFFHLFGTWRILAYQIGALLSLWGTALIVRNIASRIAPMSGAFMAALLYEIWPNLAGGEGGQSPIFYNGLVTAAIWLIVSRLTYIKESISACRYVGVAVMLLFGLAMQIKYTSIFEGLYAGILLLFFSWQKRKNLYETSMNSLLWISCAILPTVIILFFYWINGYASDWIFANFVSIFERGKPNSHEELLLIKKILLIVLPILFLWPLRRILNIRFAQAQRPIITLLNGWTCFALAGVALFGTWFPHYALPLFPPLVIQAAPLWYAPIGRISIVLVAAIGTFYGQLTLWKHHKHKGNKKAFTQIEQAIISNGGGCFFIYNGPIMLYDALPYCKLSKYQFPSLFYFKSEEHATGMNPENELRRILAQKPQHIITQNPADESENPIIRKELIQTLQKNYSESYAWIRDKRSIVVYTKKNLLPPRSK